MPWRSSPLKGAMAMPRGPGTQLRKPVRRSERIYGGLLASALYRPAREDVLSMLKSAIQGNVISVRQEKTGETAFDSDPPRSQANHRGGSEGRRPQTCLTILTNTAGRPWTVDGFKSSWGK